MISFYTPNIYDPWTNEDLIRYDKVGSQRDEIIYNSFHNAKLRLLEKNLFICSFKMKGDGYKNIYVIPITASTFVFLVYFPQIDYALQLRSYDGFPQLLDKLPLLGSVTKELSLKSEYNINDELSFSKGGLEVVVHASVGQFLFPKYKKIENEEILKKYGIINGLYAQISKEYEVLGNAIQKIHDSQKKKEAMLKHLLAKQVIKTGIKIGLYATGIGAGLAALMDIDDIWTAGEHVADISNITDLSDLADVSDVVDIMGVTDLADGLADADALSDFSDLSELAGVETFDVPNDYCFSDASSDVSFGSNDFSYYDERISSAQDEYVKNIEKATDENTSLEDSVFYADQAKRAEMDEDYWKKAREDAEYWEKIDEINKYRREAPLQIAEKTYNEIAKIYGYDPNINTWNK